MKLEPGQTLDHYAIVAPLGAGGMGHVYQARDTKLGRDVAIKVLAERIHATSFRIHDGDVSFDGRDDGEGLEELLAEARVLASLNHPNVATLFELAAHDDVSYLVMELVDGKTLAERLKAGPLALREALRIFVQIAEGLEAAHERGIAHCDLKPQNVMVTPHGAVKILDFGVASVLARPTRTPPVDSDESPTLTRPTGSHSAGTGTLPYMSPEQARGRRGDTATDIWAFGCCLYEALTGRRAFFAATPSDILVRILDREPDWEALPRSTPRRLHRLLRRCLNKEVEGRLRHIGDAGLELQDALDEVEGRGAGREAEGTGPGRESGHDRAPATALPWLLGGLAGLALGVGGALLLTAGDRLDRAPSVRRFSLNLPGDHPLQPSLPISPHRGLALSSDGRVLVYVGQSGETTQLFKRSLDRLDTEAIPGTEGAWYPFFSPDDRWVGYFDRQSRALEKVALSGGLPVPLAPLPAGVAASTGGLGASWGEDGTIVYSPVATEGLLRVPEDGGEPTRVSELAEGELYRGFPTHLPRGRGVLVMYGVGLGSGSRKVGHIDLETGKLTPLLEPASMPRYVPTGHLIVSQDGHLMAAPFDLDRLAMTGPLVRVTEPRMQSDTVEAWEWDFSDDGTLVFATASATTASGREAVWIDRGGNETTLGMHPVANGDWAMLSPDGARVVYGALDQAGNWDVHLYAMADGSNRRLTFETEFDSRPVFHPDGTRVLFTSGRGAARRIFELDLTRGGPRALSEEILGFPRSLSADGDLVFFDRAGEGASREDIAVFSRSDGRARMLLEGEAAERYPSLSPDGRWLAYESDATGRSEVYVQPVPAFDATHQVSTEGGNFPVWSAGGDRLYYRAGRALVAAAIDTTEGFVVAAREALFENPFDVDNYYFDVAPDGEHFLLLRPAVRGVTELVVVDGWFAELERLVPAD